MKVGVFDSGKGGELIATGLETLVPEYEYLVVNDREHVPYGSRSNDDVVRLTSAAIMPLVDAGCKTIVIACNTATMVGISSLRARFPQCLFIGTEPMIKPAAALSQSKKIAVLATPLTIASERYHLLAREYAGDVEIYEPDTSSWAARIESEHIDAIDFSEIDKLIQKGVDTLVLACTHYIALIPVLSRRYPTISLLEPTEALARQVRRLAHQA